jgi:hypothetical protein
VHDVRRRGDVACDGVGLIPRKRLRRSGALMLGSGGIGETPTPPALDEHAFGVAHASTHAIPNREAIPVESRGWRRFAATPGHATTRTRPRWGPRGSAQRIRRHVHVARERVGLILRKPRWG